MSLETLGEQYFPDAAIEQLIVSEKSGHPGSPRDILPDAGLRAETYLADWLTEFASVFPPESALARRLRATVIDDTSGTINLDEDARLEGIAIAFETISDETIRAETLEMLGKLISRFAELAASEVSGGNEPIRTPEELRALFIKQAMLSAFEMSGFDKFSLRGTQPADVVVLTNRLYESYPDFSAEQYIEAAALVAEDGNLSDNPEHPSSKERFLQAMGLFAVQAAYTEIPEEKRHVD